jgi:molecular chaperone GrpE (heat shock protein)
MNSSSQETAMASVIQNFLPIFEDLNYLKEKYGENDFGKSFHALTGILKSGMKELGVEEFSAGAIGDQVDTSRVIVVEEEYSNVFPKGTVIRPISSGMELQGNVMKMAECVASLGKEEEEKEEEDSNEQDESENEDETEIKE